MAEPPFFLEQIYNFQNDYIEKFLTANKRQLYDPLTNKLIATILMYNGAFLQPSDQHYVIDTLFSPLYLYNDKQLVDIANSIDIKDEVDRIRLIRLIIDKIATFDKNKLTGIMIKFATNGYKEVVSVLLDKGVGARGAQPFMFVPQGGDKR